MSEKVKVTVKQKEAIDRLNEYQSEQIKDFKKNPEKYADWVSPLNELPEKKIIDALYIGYEVEPEYKENDWIYQNGKIDRILWVNYKKNLACLDCAGIIGITNIDRHATPSEIAAEKERRWWSKHGRDVWELREKDMLIDSHGNVHEVTGVPHDLDSRYYLDYVAINFDEIKGKYSVLVFAENRLDINHD